MLALGRLTEPSGIRLHNSAGLFHLLYSNDYAALASKLPLQAADVRLAAQRLDWWREDTARSPWPDIAGYEAHVARRLLTFGCKRWLAAHGEPIESPSRLRADLTRLIGEFEAAWLARNRPGGLHESSGLLRAVLARI
jgi:hypothetical protein